MALGGRVSLRYDDELHFKVHCDRALAQRRSRGLGPDTEGCMPYGSKALALELHPVNLTRV
jgi:hypothetical protein